MRRILSIASLQFKLQFSKRATMLTLIGLPLVFTIITGGMLNGGGGGSASRVPVAIVDNDASVASREVLRELKGQAGVNAFAIAGGELKPLFIDKKVAAGVVIPRGFQADILRGSKPSVDLTVLPGGNLDATVKPSLGRALATVAKGIRTAQAMPGGDEPAGLKANYAKYRVQLQRSGVGVDASSVEKPEKQGHAGSVGELSLGFTVMFMMYLVFQMCGVILREREFGTWGRLLTSPIRKHEIMTGYLLSFVSSGLFQFAILITATSLLFRVKWGPLLPMAVIALAFTLAACGLGLFLAGVVRTPEQQGAIGNIFITVTSMLGGTFWSLDFVSPTMRRMAYFTPQAWAMDGFREVMLRGGGVGDILVPTAVLLGFALVFLSAGVARVRYE